MARAVGFLGYAGYRVYRTNTGSECDCEAPMRGTLRRTLLVAGIVATSGLIASTWIIGGAAAEISSRREVAMEDPSNRKVSLTIEGMTCASCNVTVQRAHVNLEGVNEARVTFEPPRAVVTYDPHRVTVEAMMEATANEGYPSRPIPGR